MGLTHRRYNKREVLTITLWVDNEVDNSKPKLVLGNDFLIKAKPYKIQKNRILLNINSQTIILQKYKIA